MLGKKTRNRTYLNIKSGSVVKRTDSGEENYTYVEGRLKAIFQKERTFKGEAVKYWYVEIGDDSGESYLIGFSYISNTFKSLILSLASKEGIEAVKRGAAIRIEPYLKKGFEKISVMADGVKLDWVTKDLPPIGEISIGERTIKDDSERMRFITALTEEITAAAKIGKQVIK